MTLSAQGLSSPTGFSITLWNEETGSCISGKTLHHNPRLSARRVARSLHNPWLRACYVMTFCAGLVSVLAFAYFFLVPGILGAIVFLLCMPLFFITWHGAVKELAITSYLFWHRDLARWHSCEHKLIDLYLNDRPRAHEELKKARRISSACGSMKGFQYAALPILPLSVLTTYFLGTALSYLSPAAILLIVGVPVCLFVISSVFFGPFGLQWLIATAKPTPAQYDATLELAARLDLVLTLDEITSFENASQWEAPLFPSFRALLPVPYRT
ncbi:MAG: hypothetical protein A2806_00945 [Candidatus Terrybacteria bacterium RIFCSPHIGHO2_01_FULL_48_17]|uniref:Uncharacterized protein n=1 Tax=Candidatus Terrybacteria bacterium RIFCSPHIGHO2_01_FULL_48_17 TaxID=1802362 RepID=A0A1G2PK34_9BACT|nr:MAG: hypothetical protein A2806_00945 [Candidatus Terrybacteria bacterium RIFCSPHIGHO2_01_FULL_48_17]OHA51885.1 MAG: hypothetical protein A3A30_00960 [Candidatus Terrybacteria bacterium RIFCSPLOWO2_01_FULL_48_14]